MSKTGETLTFSYNVDGLRTRKVSTTTGTTEYTLHGKNIVHMTRGSNSLHFYYDAQSRPAVVTFNGTDYAYLYSLQGDVIALVDGTGTKVVEYTYDAWGKPTGKTGTLASTLGTVQPFRYRGYVYDEESGLYYLRSRYYRCEWCRFLNADSIVNGNLFAYCRNSCVTAADSDGNDAYWLTDTDGLPVVGHTSLLMQHGNGSWYYFYWGPSVYLPLTYPEVIMRKVEVTINDDGLIDLHQLNDYLQQDIYEKKRFEYAIRFEGDYSESVEYALELKNTYDFSLRSALCDDLYSLFTLNCMQQSARVLQRSTSDSPWNFLLFESIMREWHIPNLLGLMLSLFTDFDVVRD